MTKGDIIIIIKILYRLDLVYTVEDPGGSAAVMTNHPSRVPAHIKREDGSDPSHAAAAAGHVTHRHRPRGAYVLGRAVTNAAALYIQCSIERARNAWPLLYNNIMCENEHIIMGLPPLMGSCDRHTRMEREVFVVAAASRFLRTRVSPFFCIKHNACTDMTLSDHRWRHVRPIVCRGSAYLYKTLLW